MSHLLTTGVLQAARNRLSGETPLQAACIAAWDMQEESGPLIAAKGNVEIPAFNSPGFTTDGPAQGITARVCTGGLDQRFAAKDHPVFQMPSSGQKTFRCWVYDETGGNAAGLMTKGVNPSVNPSGSEYSFNTDGSGMRCRIRRADDTGRLSLSVSNFPFSEWVRVEIFADGDTGDVRFQHGESFVTGNQAQGFLVNDHDFTIFFNDFLGRDQAMCCLAIFDRELTEAEREADQTPRVFADL